MCFSKLQTGIQLQKVLKSEYTFKLYNHSPLCPIILAQLQAIRCKVNPIGGGGKKQLHICAYHVPKAEKCVFGNFMCIVMCYYLTSAIWSVTTAKPLLTSRWQFASVFSDFSSHQNSVLCKTKRVIYIYNVLLLIVMLAMKFFSGVS